MNSVKTVWNLGNFTVGLESSVNDEIRDRLASLGLRFLGQRNTEVDKILGGFETIGGKAKRRKDWKRNDVEFSEALASKLATSFAELELPKADGEDTAVVVKTDASVVLYEREAAELKFRDAKEVAGRHESAGDLEEWLAVKCEYTGATHGADGEFDKAMLAAVHKVVVAHLAAMKAGI